MSTIQRASQTDGAVCTENAAHLIGVDVNKIVADSIQAAHDSVGMDSECLRLRESYDRAQVIDSFDDALDQLRQREAESASGSGQSADSLESTADGVVLHEVARDTASVLSTLDALGVESFAHAVNVMDTSVSVGGVGMVASFAVHATDTRPVTDSTVLNLANAATHTAVDSLVDSVFVAPALAENLIGSAANFMPQDSAGRVLLEGAQQVMPTAQVRGGLYAVADLQTAGYSAVVDAVQGDGPGGLYQSADAIAESSRAGDYGGVARLLQQSVDVVVPDQRGAPVPGTDFHFVADAR